MTLYNVTPAIEDMLYPNVTTAEELDTSKDFPWAVDTVTTQSLPAGHQFYSQLQLS